MIDCDLCGMPGDLCECFGPLPGYVYGIDDLSTRIIGYAEEVPDDSSGVVFYVKKYPVFFQKQWWIDKEGDKISLSQLTKAHLLNIRRFVVKKFGETVTDSIFVKELDRRLDSYGKWTF